LQVKQFPPSSELPMSKNLSLVLDYLGRLAHRHPSP
jgi:hypothetical protein